MRLSPTWLAEKSVEAAKEDQKPLASGDGNCLCIVKPSCPAGEHAAHTGGCGRYGQDPYFCCVADSEASAPTIATAAPAANNYYSCGFNCANGCDSCTGWNNSTNWCGQSEDNCAKGCKGLWCPAGPPPVYRKCGYKCGGKCPTPKEATCTGWVADTDGPCGTSAAGCAACKGMWCPEGPFPQPAAATRGFLRAMKMK